MKWQIRKTPLGMWQVTSPTGVSETFSTYERAIQIFTTLSKAQHILDRLRTQRDA